MEGTWTASAAYLHSLFSRTCCGILEEARHYYFAAQLSGIPSRKKKMALGGLQTFEHLPKLPGFGTSRSGSAARLSHRKASGKTLSNWTIACYVASPCSLSSSISSSSGTPRRYNTLLHLQKSYSSCFNLDHMLQDLQLSRSRKDSLDLLAGA